MIDIMGHASIALLNVGTGDTKLTFDKTNMAETIRAARIEGMEEARMLLARGGHLASSKSLGLYIDVARKAKS